MSEDPQARAAILEFGELLKRISASGMAVAREMIALRKRVEALEQRVGDIQAGRPVLKPDYRPVDAVSTRTVE